VYVLIKFVHALKY